MIPMNKQFKQLLKLLMRTPDNQRGYGHYWYKQSGLTKWWEADNPPEPPKLDEDIYFGVHPAKTSKRSNQRPIEEDILAVNCLYADFDLKLHDESREKALEHINSLRYPPTATILSGGGYHCYWVLTDPFLIDSTTKREIAKDLQGDWVRYVNADLAVRDLARILRVPDTKNHKYNPPKDVEMVDFTPANQYTLIELQAALPATNDHSGGGGDGAKEIPKPIRPNELTEQETVNLILESDQADQFKLLFKGIDEGYESASEADMAFCSILAFWTGGDYRKIDRIFKASERMRPKWERDDYRDSTIKKAILRVDNFYIHPGGYLTAGAHDDGNAEVVAHKTKKEICYTEAYGWMRYMEGHWETELAEPYTEKRVAEVLKKRRSAAVRGEQDAIVKAAKPNTGNIMRAKSLLRHKCMVPVAKFDGDLDSINCINGVLNLRTGKLSPHSYRKRFTYVIPTEYDPEADPSFWLSWLGQALNEEERLIDYLQLALGYTLSGRTREEIMFYLYGPQRAGKGVFIESLISMLGGRPIATEVDIDLFMSNSRSSSSVGFSLAALKASRFVAASESDERQWLNARGIKRWTGGNLITCAHKYGRDFTYRPQFKIWLTSNYPPQMDAEDSAAWGRLRVIEFPNSYVGKEDKMLKSKMREPSVQRGILKWCVEGAMRWYKLDHHGLQTPEPIEVETKKARENLDWVGTWVEENVKIMGNGHTTHEEAKRSEYRIPTDLYYPDYRSWCEDNGVSPKSLRSLNRSLRKAGYIVSVPAKVNGKTKRCWMNAQLKGYMRGLRELSEEVKNGN